MFVNEAVKEAGVMIKSPVSRINILGLDSYFKHLLVV
jgi:hypothetical protein